MKEEAPKRPSMAPNSWSQFLVAPSRRLRLSRLSSSLPLPENVYRDRLEARPFAASWGRKELKSERGGSHPLTCTHTSADQPCILSVVTVAPAPGASGTVPEGFLSSSTPHIVHPHGSLTRSESGTPRCGQCSPTSQLPTSHSCISEVPSIIADSAPTSTVPDFQAASTSMGTRDQTQPFWGGLQTGKKED